MNNYIEMTADERKALYDEYRRIKSILFAIPPIDRLIHLDDEEYGYEYLQIRTGFMGYSELCLPNIKHLNFDDPESESFKFAAQYLFPYTYKGEAADFLRQYPSLWEVIGSNSDNA